MEGMDKMAQKARFQFVAAVLAGTLSDFIDRITNYNQIMHYLLDVIMYYDFFFVEVRVLKVWC